MLGQSCEMCLMPFKKDKGNRESQAYCSYCFKNGDLVYKGDDIKKFQQLCYQSMIKHGTNKFLAKFYTWLVAFAPYWKKIKKQGVKNERT